MLTSPLPPPLALSLLCAPRPVTIHVTPVNDPPHAVDDRITINEDEEASGNVLLGQLSDGVADSDPENGKLTVTTKPVSNPGSGTVVLDAEGVFTYCPNPDFYGDDSFVYEIKGNASKRV